MKSLTDEEKYSLLTHASKPNPNSNFPPNSSGRRFQYKWLSEFHWLAYSESLDGAFCINCVLFAGEESSHNTTKLDRLYKSPFTTRAIGPRKFREHSEKSPLHRTATVLACHFKQRMEQRCRSVDVQLNRLVNNNNIEFLYRIIYQCKNTLLSLESCS